MKNECEECGKCCMETEMILSEEDINLILKNSINSLEKEEFVFLNVGGYYQLKNVDNHCIFLDPVLKLCKIYKHRPQGCRFYPMIYDVEKKRCIIDKECPRPNLFYQDQKEFEKICKHLKRFVKSKLNLG